MSKNIFEISSKKEESGAGDVGQSKQFKNWQKRNPITIPSHIKTLTDGPTRFYQCRPCGKKFKTKAHIKYHAYCQNKDGDKPFKCSECGREFVVQSHYEYHLRVHSGERPFPCPQCGKGFSQRGKLTRHEKAVHAKEKAFACEQCPKTFASKQFLQVHTRTHTGERPFACTHCGKGFTCSTNLKKHVIGHTRKIPFICDQCGKTFRMKCSRDLHMKTHSNGRRFSCKQCPKVFSNGKDLRRHCLTHTNSWPWTCFACHNKPNFRRFDNLSRHVKKAHSESHHTEVIKLAKEAAAQYLMEKLKDDSVNFLKPAAIEAACASIGDPVPHRPAQRGKFKNTRHISRKESDERQNEEMELATNYLIDNHGEGQVSTLAHHGSRLNDAVSKVACTSSTSCQATLTAESSIPQSSPPKHTDNCSPLGESNSRVAKPQSPHLPLTAAPGNTKADTGSQEIEEDNSFYCTRSSSGADDSNQAEIILSEDNHDQISFVVNSTVTNEARHSNLSEIELLTAESILSLSTSNIAVNSALLGECNSVQERDTVIMFAPQSSQTNSLDCDNYLEPESQENEEDININYAGLNSISDDDHNMTFDDTTPTNATHTGAAIANDIFATAPMVSINETQNLVVVDISDIGGVGSEQSVYVCYKCLETFDTVAQFTSHAPCQSSRSNKNEPPFPAGDAMQPLYLNHTEFEHEKNSGIPSV